MAQEMQMQKWTVRKQFSLSKNGESKIDFSSLDSPLESSRRKKHGNKGQKLKQEWIWPHFAVAQLWKINKQENKPGKQDNFVCPNAKPFFACVSGNVKRTVDKT